VVIVATEDDLPSQLLIDSPRPILATVGTTMTRGIAGRATTRGGIPRALAGISLTAPGDVTFSSPVLSTNFLGQFEGDLIFGCTPGSGMITASLNSDMPDTRMIAYTASVGPAASMEKAQGDLQVGTAGELLGAGNQALIAELKDSCGNAIRSEPVTWEVSPPGGVTFENKFNSTNASGRTLAVVRLGDQIGPVLVTAYSGGLSTTFTLTVTGMGNEIEISGGDDQLIPIGAPAPAPLAVTIRDLEGTPVSGADVQYTVTHGSLQLSSTSAQTNVQGRASVSIIGNSALGVATVEARSGALVVVFNLEVVGRKPVVSSVGFVNAGSFIVGFVPGSAGSIFGVGLMEGIDGVVLADTFPFPLELRGVKVFVDGIQCPITSISNVNGTEQINIQIPFEVRAPSDAIVVTIDNNGALSSFSNVQTFRAQPGFFEIPENGKRVVAALHLDFRRVSSENPARPGEVILLFLTGMGPLRTPVGTNVPGPGAPPAETVENPVVMIDGVEQQVLGGARAPARACLPGAPQPNTRATLVLGSLQGDPYHGKEQRFSTHLRNSGGRSRRRPCSRRAGSQGGRLAGGNEYGRAPSAGRPNQDRHDASVRAERDPPNRAGRRTDQSGDYYLPQPRRIQTPSPRSRSHLRRSPPRRDR